MSEKTEAARQLEEANRRLYERRRELTRPATSSTSGIDSVVASIEAQAERARQMAAAIPAQQSLDTELVEKARQADELNKALAAAGVGQRYIRESLETYLPENEKQISAKEWAVEYCAQNKAKDGDGALLTGDPKSGKTHLLCSILREYAARGASVGYVTVEDFFLDLQSVFAARGHTEADVLRKYSLPSVLVLDDLQHIKSADSAWQYRRLWTLLDRRYRDMRATLCSTNLSIGEFTEMIDQRTRRRLEATVIQF